MFLCNLELPVLTSFTSCFVQLLLGKEDLADCGLSKIDGLFVEICKSECMLQYCVSRYTFRENSGLSDSAEVTSIFPLPPSYQS